MTFEIIVPGRFIEPKDPVSLTVGIEGWFDLAAIRNGRVVRKRSFKEPMQSPFQNLILNQGLNRFGDAGYNNLYGYLSLGIGTTPPADLDTTLANGIFHGNPGRTASHGGRVAPNWENQITISWLTEIGELGNNNLTEIGVGGSSAGSLFSRALIADANGDPTAFPISENEQLQASYRLIMYPPLEDGEFQVDVSGARDVITRALGVNQVPSGSGVSGWGLAYNFSQFPVNNYGFNSRALYTGDIVGITDGNPSGVLTNSGGSSSTMGYINNSHVRGGRATWPSPQAVSSNIRSHVVNFGGSVFQIQYDPPLEKTSDQTMFLDYEFGWARK